MTNSRENDPFAASTLAPNSTNPALTPTARKTYEFYLKHRDQPLSAGELLVRHLPRWAILSIAIAASSVAFLVLNSERSAGFGGSADSNLLPCLLAGVVGVLLNGLLRDLASIRAVLKVWPVQAAVLDYAKIERLLWGEPAPIRRSDEPLDAIPVEVRAEDGL